MNARPGAFVNLERLGGSGGPIELLGASVACITQPITQGSIGRDAAKFRPPGFKIFRVKLNGGIGDDFAEGTAIGTDDRTSAGHGFERRESEAFVKGGVNTGAGGLVEQRQIVCGNKAEGADVRGVRRLTDSGMNHFRSVPVAPSKDKLPGRIAGGFESIEGRNEPDMIFAGVFKTRYVNEIGPIKAEAIGHQAGCRGAIARIKASVIEAVIDHVDRFEWQFEEAIQIVGGGLADRDDFMLTPNEPANNDAGVEHATPIIFLREMERGQIVNGGNERTGMLPDETAVTGDVQQIESQLAGQSGQRSLMPEDVCDRVAKSFGNRDDLHVARGEFEKRPIVLENEQREVVTRGVPEKSLHEGEHVLADAAFAPLDDRCGNSNFHGNRLGVGAVC